jgi:hypothetical protein
MSALKIEQAEAKAQHVKVTADRLTVDLTDGRTVSVPVAWFPRLLHGSARERNNWRFMARGQGIHWVDLDEDISVDDLLQGQQSRESHTSFEKWMQNRRGKSSSRQETPKAALQPPLARKKRSLRRG